jgi:EAL domain-containing protein (putative c-di-GMP-specific phosphodiesterase class I)
LRQWQNRYNRGDLHVAVNISSVQLRRHDVVSLVGDVLEETGLTAGSLWLEITESVVLERTEEALRVLQGLNALGVTLCMDDFGTGYSSLSYLKDFSVNILKIDRTFIRTLAEDPRDRELTKAMVDVAAALRLDGVVAEGVETQDQATVLEALGCSLAQGYLYGKPVPPEDATRAADPLLPRPAGAPSLRAHGTTTPGLPRQRSPRASDGSPDRASRAR